MEQSLILKKLESVDKELHLVIDELRKSKKHKPLSLSQLNELMEKDRISDIDSTELIRQMREKEYGE